MRNHQQETEPKKSVFSEKALWISVLSLAIPVIIENVSQTLLGVVDMYFVGKLGAQSIAGVGLTNMLMNVYIAFFFAVGIGTTALVARSVGAGKPERVAQALSQSVLIALLLGAAVGGVNLLFGRQILTLLGADPLLLGTTLPYYRVISVPAILLSLMTAVSSALRGMGDTRTPMKVALMANFINIVLDYVLIFGIGPFAGFGMVGAAIATSFSRLFSAGILLKLVLSHPMVRGLKWTSFFQFQAETTRAILRVGIPAGIEKLFMRFGQLTYVGLILKIGTVAYATHSIGGTIETLSFLPGMGFAMAASTLVGQHLGAGQPDLAHRSGLVAYFMGGAFMTVMGVIFFFFGAQLAGFFTDDPEIILLAGRIFKIKALFEPFVAVTVILTGALQGAGDTKVPMWITFAGIWIFRVIGIYILALRLGWGLPGAWFAVSIDVTVRGTILFIRFARGKWKEIQIL